MAEGSLEYRRVEGNQELKYIKASGIDTEIDPHIQHVATDSLSGLPLKIDPVTGALHTILTEV